MSVWLRRLARLSYDPRKRYALRTYLASKLAGKLGPYISTRQEGGVFVVPSTDRVTIKNLTLHYDNVDCLTRYLDLARRYRAPGSGGTVFIDVGANWGTTSVRAARQPGIERVLAFEPSADNLKLLRANVALNGLDDRIEVISFGASSTARQSTLTINEANPGDNRIAPDDASGIENFPDQLGRPTEAVSLMPIDDLPAATLEAVGFLWIDTQGYEAKVLGGAGRLLARKVPVLMEFSPYHLRLQKDVERLFELATTHYSGFFDMSDIGKEGKPRPISALPLLLPEYDRNDPHHFTDVLLV